MSELHEKILDKYSFECCQCDEYKSIYLIHESNLKNIINLCMDAFSDDVSIVRDATSLRGRELGAYRLACLRIHMAIESLKEQDL